MAKRTAIGTDFDFGNYNFGSEGGEERYFFLGNIRPDPLQPRRLMPDDLAEMLWAGKITPIDLMIEWLQRAESSDTSIDTKRTVRGLKDLATTIEQVGLINPITIREGENEDEYFIVTGERRYWAHVLLASQKREVRVGEVSRTATEIRAIIAPPGITVRAHQLIENMAREGIDPVEQATGLYALRYELSGIDPAHGQGSVSESTLVPWRRVEELMGISESQRRRYTNVLELSEAAQNIIRQYNLSERLIRPVVAKLRGKDDLQVQVLRQVAAWIDAESNERNVGRNLTQSVKQLVDEVLRNTKKPVSHTAAAADRYLRFQKQIARVSRFVSKLDREGRETIARDISRAEDGGKVIEELRALQRNISEILDNVEQD